MTRNQTATERPGGFTYAQVEEIIARLNGVTKDRRATLQSRIKQWQKLGLLQFKVGRGNRAQYRLESVLQLLTHVHITTLGLPPERAIAATLLLWNEWREGYVRAFYELLGDSKGSIFAHVQINALRDLREDGKKPGMFLSVVTGPEICEALAHGYAFYRSEGRTKELGRARGVLSDLMQGLLFDLTAVLSNFIAIAWDVTDGDKEGFIARGMYYLKWNFDHAPLGEEYRRMRDDEEYRRMRNAGENEHFEKLFSRFLENLFDAAAAASEIDVGMDVERRKNVSR